MLASRFVDGRPDRCSERSAAVHASRFEWSVRADYTHTAIGVIG
jgi:hypothetical protein